MREIRLVILLSLLIGCYGCKDNIVTKTPGELIGEQISAKYPTVKTCSVYTILATGTLTLESGVLFSIDGEFLITSPGTYYNLNHVLRFDYSEIVNNYGVKVPNLNFYLN